MLDQQIARELRTPTPWELAQWRASSGADRLTWERNLDQARFCYLDAPTWQEVETALMLFRRDRTRRPRTKRPFSEIARLSYSLARGLFSWERADYYAASGGLVTLFWDKVALESEGAVPNARSVDPAHAFAQISTARQVALPTPHASLGGQLAAKGVRANSTLYTTTLALTDWSWTVQDAGTGIYAVIVAPSATSGTQWILGALAVSIGMDLFWANDTSVQARLLPGMGRSIPGVAVNSAGLVRFRHATALSPDSTLSFTGKTPSTGNYSAGLGTNPDANMTIFGIGPGSFDGHVAEYMFSKDVSSTLDALVIRYVLLRYGLVA